MHKITRLKLPHYRSLLLTWLLFIPMTHSHASALKILVVGDSLSSAYGLAVEDGWVALLQKRLQQQPGDYTVINSSVTGDTTANGLSRLPRALADHNPTIVIIELGGNDGLRGLSISQLRKNLTQMIELVTESQAQSLLVGVQIPTNYGARYGGMFSESFSLIAAETNAALVPFLLDGFERDLQMFQPDGIHPNGAAQQIMLDNVWRYLQPLLR